MSALFLGVTVHVKIDEMETLSTGQSPTTAQNLSLSNSLNTGKGRTFQERAAEVLGNHFSVKFRLDYPISIGSPAKPHRFDLASDDNQYVGECKNYAWTETGNVPSAKMGFMNEALFYLSYLSKDTHRFIAMRMERHAKRKESLANYYVRTYNHLLGGIKIYEIDIDSGEVRNVALID